MSRRHVSLLVAGLLALPALGCLPDTLETSDEAPDARRVQVRFLGVGGLLIRRGPDAILFAPLYSSPDPVSLAHEIPPRKPVLDRFYREHRIDRDAADLRAILVGHAHYDHLMDVPYFMEKAPQAHVLGNVTLKRVLAGYGPAVAARVVALNEAGRNLVDFRNCAGQPFPAGCVVTPGDGGAAYEVPGTHARLRVRAYCSRHPPQVGPVHFFPGCEATERSSPPLRAEHYKEGEVLSYLVDFMEAGRVAFRVYYQDAPVGGRLAAMPAAVIAERPTDLALLCTGNFDVVDHPERIVSALQAREVILHHWEGFFDPTHATLTPLPKLDIDGYHARVSAELGGHPERVHLLKPGLLRNFPREAGTP